MSNTGGAKCPITFLILPDAVSSALNRVVYFENVFKLSNKQLSATCRGPIEYPRTSDSIGPQVPLSHLDRVYTRLQQCGAQTAN